MPNIFMTLSYADLHWSDLIANIFKLKQQNINEENVKNVSYFWKCEILNENPVFVARHSQSRVEVFFSEILMDSDHSGKLNVMQLELSFSSVAHHIFIPYF